MVSLLNLELRSYGKLLYSHSYIIGDLYKMIACTNLSSVSRTEFLNTVFIPSLVQAAGEVSRFKQHCRIRSSLVWSAPVSCSAVTIRLVRMLPETKIYKFIPEKGVVYLDTLQFYYHSNFSERTPFVLCMGGFIALNAY